jgi:hypothetical protein
MHHVHNWQLKIKRFDPRMTQNEKGWYGFYAERYWECIRGGKVKHVMPSKEYPAYAQDFDSDGFFRWKQLEPKVFVALSGSPYVVEDPY